MRLFGRIEPFPGEPCLGKICHVAGDSDGREEFSLVDGHGGEVARLGFSPTSNGTVRLPQHLQYLAPGDVLRLNPEAGEVIVLYRARSLDNVIFLTGRCNSRCAFCPQPPHGDDDSYLIDEALSLLDLIPPEAQSLCINGGEPTLAFHGLISVLEKAKAILPNTSIQMLTNGRVLAYLQYASRIASVKHPDLIFGIPLYSDVAEIHDSIVQCRGAFDQTVLGIHNLARLEQQIQLRTVLSRPNIHRLRQWAYFVARNFPFVEHVALMGIELTGFARRNRAELWCDPEELASELVGAAEILDAAGVNTSIFNLPHCMLPESLWGLVQKSVSDWKASFSPKCQRCRARADCGGFFSSWGQGADGIVRPVLENLDRELATTS